MFEERIKWINHKGKQIVFLDFSKLLAHEVVDMLKAVENFYEVNIVKPGKNDILILSDVTGAKIFGDSLTESKRVVKKYRPYSYKSAMVGLTSAKVILLKTINMFAGEKKASKYFSGLDEAKDYLVE